MPLKSSITSCVYCSWCLSGWPPVPAIVSIQNVASACVALALPPGGIAAGGQERRIGGATAGLDDAVIGRHVHESPALHGRALKRGLECVLQHAVGVLDDVLRHPGSRE